MLRPILALVFLLAATVSVAEPELPPESHSRGGLPHTAAKLEQHSDLRVAFLGGSITATNGWRTGILAHFRRTYPKSNFAEIFAAIPGTGSDFGAARLQTDVLRHSPDLLFVEYAVNDTGRDPISIRRSIEGLVRQTRRLSPTTDLCFVYTLSASGLPDLKAGRYPAPAAAMEDVASHYAIPTVHFGVEVVRRLYAGTLVFTGEPTSFDVSVFATDGVHPGGAGHALYTEVLARALADVFKTPATARDARELAPAPLEPAHWEGARMIPLDALASAGVWTRLPENDERFLAINGGLRRSMWITETPGVVLEFAFTGTAFGFAGLKGPDAGRFRVTVDDAPPVTGTLFDAHSRAGRWRERPWFYPQALSPGMHTVRVELLDAGPDKAAILRLPPAAVAAEPAYADNRLTWSHVIEVGGGL